MQDLLYLCEINCQYNSCFDATWYQIYFKQVDINSREAKKLKSNNLRTALKEEQVFGERRIYIQLPKESDHCNHRKGPVSN